MALKIKKFLAVLTISLMTFVPVLLPITSSSAYATVPINNICNGITQSSTGTANGSCGSSSATATLGTLAHTIVTTFTYIVGVISVIMLIVAGFKYVTSGGDSNKVSSAKNTLIYALVGIVVVIAAQVIVSFVANTASTSVTAA